MKDIQLTKGKVTVVDDDDFKQFGKLKWHYSHGRAVRRYGAWAREKYGHTGTTWLHREIMGNPEGLVVDHINGNPLDNRKENLRICTQSQNLANARKQTRHTSSQYKGVYYAPRNRNHWQAYFTPPKSKRINLGSFATEEEAATAYNRIAIETHGEFTYMNQKKGRVLS